MTSPLWRMPRLIRLVALTLTSVATACADQALTSSSDASLKARVEAALLSAADVPGSQLSVDVRDGEVFLTGNFVCEECGQMSTPGGAKTVEQSVGAVIRAIPGVGSVRFETTVDADS
jgi:osmotically-inducible protein OsmY